MSYRLSVIAWVVLLLGSFGIAQESRIAPADKPAGKFDGTWEAEFDTQRGSQKYTFDFKQDGTSFTANGIAELDGQKREIEFQDVELKDNTLTFVEVLDAQGRELRITYTGSLAEGEIKFHRAVGNFGSSDFIAKRSRTTKVEATPEPQAPAPSATPTTSPASQTQAPAAEPTVSLRDVFKDSFKVGAALNRSMTLGRAFRRSEEEVAQDVALVKQQFNHIVAENDMKWQMIHPRPGADGFDFAPADALIAFAKDNNMEVAGHTLVWHSQTPNWVFEGTHTPADENTDQPQDDSDRTQQPGNELTVSPPRSGGPNRPNPGNPANPPAPPGAGPGRGRGGQRGGPFGGFRGFDLNGPRASREELLERMREHIHTVVGRYKGQVRVWDVVNEAISDSGPDVLRRSPWSVIIGPDFIAKAFEYAHEADPDAILRYNDYGLENPEKRSKLVKLIKTLQEQNVPIGAIGSQAHCNVSTTYEAMDEAIAEMKTLGLPIHITELDVNSATAGQRGTGADIAANAATTQGGLVTDADSRLAATYANLFRAFVKHRDAIDVVVFWGVNDAVSWRAQGRPLLFDGSNKPKPAFDAVIQVAR